MNTISTNSITNRVANDSCISSGVLSFDDICSSAAQICYGQIISEEKAREKMPNKAKSVIHLDSYGKNLYLKIADKEGYVDCDKYVMSEITDVQVIERPYKPQIIVSFADGTSEIATLDYYDQFNLEQGISTCIAKKMFSKIVGKDFGGSTYNKIIDRAVKVFRKNEKEREKKAAEEEAKKRKYEKMVAKKKAKCQKREAEAREKQIEIQKEAILRALHQWNTRAAD